MFISKVINDNKMKFFGIVIVIFGYFMNASCVHFEVRSKFPGGACILFDIDATFNLTYTKDKKTESSPSFSLKGAKVDDDSSKCGNEFLGTTSVLSVTLFPTKEHLMFRFKRQGGTVVMSARLTVEPKKHFKNWNTTGTVDLIDEKDLTVGPDTPNSFLCYTEEIMTFQTYGSQQFVMKMSLTNLHVQAYRIKNSGFSPAVECSQDLMSSTFQPETTVTVGPHGETTTQEPESTSRHHPETTTEPQSNTTTEPSLKTTTEHQSNTTTEPSLETTTHSQAETTTEPQSNTTTEPSPETTTEPQSNTTTEPSPETTTEPQSNTTTEPSPETTTIMTPTSSVSPHNRYVVRDKKEVCIVMQGDIQFEIPYQRKDGTTTTRNITVPNDVRVSGNCSYNGTDSAQEITLTFFNTSWVLDIVIAKERHGMHENFMRIDALSGTKDYSWQALRLSYVMDVNFPNAKNSGEKIQAVADGTFGKFKANTDGSYKCKAKQDLELGKDMEIKMDLTKMQYRAFGKTNSTEFSNTGVSECPEDNNNNNNGGVPKTLGIALGCSLAGLVLIVFGAWFVVRYRKKKAEELSYESIQ